MEVTSEDKKAIRKQRVMTYFVDAAIRIIRQDGFDAITIRRIGDEAGYNSATIYSYFDSLEKLVAYASLKMLDKYLHDIDALYWSEENILIIYLKQWELYCYSSFRNPELYIKVFYSDTVLPYLADYCRDFPNAYDGINPVFAESFMQMDSDTREKTRLRQLADEGFISQEDIEFIFGFEKHMHGGFLLQMLLEKDREENVWRYTNLFFQYFLEMLDSRMLINMDLSIRKKELGLSCFV